MNANISMAGFKSIFKLIMAQRAAGGTVRQLAPFPLGIKDIMYVAINSQILFRRWTDIRLGNVMSLSIANFSTRRVRALDSDRIRQIIS